MIKLVLVIQCTFKVEFCVINYRIVFLIYRYIFSISMVSLKICYVNGSVEERF